MCVTPAGKIGNWTCGMPKSLPHSRLKITPSFSLQTGSNRLISLPFLSMSTPKGSGVLNLFRRPVKLAELQVYFEHVNQLFAGQSAKRRSRVLLQDLIDLRMDRRLVALDVVSPLGGYTIKLKLGILQGDVRVETGTGSGHEIARHILKIGIRMILAPHIKKVRLDIRALFDRLNGGLRLAVRTCLRDGGWEHPGMIVREILEEQHGQIRGLGLRRCRIVLDPLRDQVWMRLGPGINKLPVCRIPGHPSLCDCIVQVGPLRHDVWSALVLVLLKPGFNVGSNQLPRLGAALILYDRPERRCHAVAQ